MKAVFFILIAALAGTSSGWFYSFSAGNAFKNEQCYILLKANYQSERGNEHIESVITLSLLPNKGRITVNSELKTADNISTSLMQRMDFVYDAPKNDEYTLKINSLVDSSSNERIPEGTSTYTKSLLKIYLTDPKTIKLKIKKEHNGDYILYNNVIPWLYCNRMK